MGMLLICFSRTSLGFGSKLLIHFLPKHFLTNFSFVIPGKNNFVGLKIFQVAGDGKNSCEIHGELEYEAVLLVLSSLTQQKVVTNTCRLDQFNGTI